MDATKDAGDRVQVAKRPPSGVEGETGLNLADLVDAAMLRPMMDDFYELTNIPMSLIDLQGDVVVKAGWQDVCTRFHRVNADTYANCIESVTLLTADIAPGEMRLHQCKNGMWYAVTPVFAGSERVGNLLTGQFFFDDEPVDMAFFSSQAERYGFDQHAYLAAVESAPRLSRTLVETGLLFLTKLANMVSQLTFSNEQRAIAQANLTAALSRQTALTDELAAERGVLQAIMENTDAHLAYLDPEFNFVAVNSTYARGSGHPESELIGKNHFELFPDAENEAAFERARESGEPLEYRAKPFFFADQPWRGVTYWDWRLTAVKDVDGALKGFAFSLMDVTRSVREKAFSDAINQLNDVIHSDLDFSSILAQFVPQLANVIGCEAVAVALRSPQGTWRFQEVFGLPEELTDLDFEDAQAIGAATAMESGRPVVVGRGENPKLAEKLGLQTMLSTSLSVADHEFGVLAFGYVSGPGEFDEGAIDFAGKIAASMSLALNNSRLFHSQQRSAQLSEALAKVNEVLLSALTLEDVLAGLVGEASEAAGADKCLVIEINDDHFTPIHVRNIGEGLVGKTRDSAYFPGFASAANEGQPILIEDCWTDPRTNKDFVVPYQLRAFQLLPLYTRGRVTHVLALAYDEPRSFDGEDYQSAVRMTAAMSVALNNARMFEIEHHIADRLQEALLALPDQIAGVQFARAYHSATEAARVGGDFYDIFELGDHHVGITIGDISGKGIDAAMLTALVKNTIRAHASEKGKTPAQVLALTNHVVYRSTPSEAFATVLFAVLNRREGRLVYANAGHTTGALVHPDGSVVRLAATGPLLGGFEHGEFEEATVQFGVGDLLFLYTDGLTEARQGGVRYGEERVFTILPTTRISSAKDVVAEVIDDVMSFTDSRLRDDLAILAVSRLE